MGLGDSFIMPDADGLSKYVIISAIYHSSKKANNQRKYRTSKLFAPFIRSPVDGMVGQYVKKTDSNMYSVSRSVSQSVVQSFGRSVGQPSNQSIRH